MRVLLADDEKPARARLSDLLASQSDVEIVGEARDGKEALALLAETKPDLLFLDIQMPELDGFGVLRGIPPTALPVTIFVTAYDQYAIRAFEAHALDYLLKPFSDERFESALDRARHALRNRQAGELALRISSLLSETPSPGGSRWDRLVIRSAGKVTFLNTEEIDWIEAAGVYVYLHSGGKPVLYRSTIGQLMERLDPRQFVRVHRSAAVNTGRIHELHPRTHGDYSIVLKDGTEVILSRSYRAALEKWLRQPL